MCPLNNKYYANLFITFVDFRRKHCFGLYILELQSIWSLHFGNSQFGPSYFQLTTNLVLTVNSLTDFVYVANGLHS